MLELPIRISSNMIPLFIYTALATGVASVIILIAFATTESASAGSYPEGFSVPECTISPDGKFGVLVADEAHYDVDATQHKIVEIATGRILGELPPPSGMDADNYVGVEPKWNADGSLLLWTISGRWAPRNLVFVRLDGGKVIWQTNLLKQAQETLLARAKKSSPARYEAAKKQNADSGKALPEGFTTLLTLPEDVELPYRFEASIESNPKGIETYPQAAQLTATIKVSVGDDGAFQVTDYIPPEK
jgi:hypothetical protein